MIGGRNSRKMMCVITEIISQMYKIGGKRRRELIEREDVVSIGRKI